MKIVSWVCEHCETGVGNHDDSKAPLCHVCGKPMRLYHVEEVGQR